MDFGMAIAMAAPIPLLPPVTRIRLPVNSFASNELPDDDALIAGL
jgi:hypothetical protein